MEFLEPIKAGHVFFYDLETDEVVHFRGDIYEAAQASNEGMNLDLTKEEQRDAEDAWEILDDQMGRYQSMPAPDATLIEEWEKEFSDSGVGTWEAFQAERVHGLLQEWLDTFKDDSSEEGEETSATPAI